MNNTGTHSEALFLTKCLELNYTVSKPFSDNTRYDFIVDKDNSLYRVQIKSTNYKRSDNQYAVRLRYQSKIHYTSDDIDFYAVHIIPEDDWYIFPISFANTVQFWVTENIKGKYEKYKNNFGFVM
jgi:hypothetical protein